MTQTNTTLLQLPLLAAAQAQKHVTHNEAILKLDALAQLAVIDRDLTEPPAEPNDGDRYMPASGATGAWEDWDWNIAWFVDGVWTKLVPRPGWQAWVEDEALLLVWDGAEWVEGGGGAEIVELIPPTPFPATEVLDITDIPNTFRALILTIADLEMDTDNRRWRMQCSVDNGQTFFMDNGDYANIMQNSNSGHIDTINRFGGATESQDEGDTDNGSFTILNYQGGAAPLCLGIGFQTINGSQSGFRYFQINTFLAATDPVNALRLMLTGSGAFAGGTYALSGLR